MYTIFYIPILQVGHCSKQALYHYFPEIFKSLCLLFTHVHVRVRITLTVTRQTEHRPNQNNPIDESRPSLRRLK